MAQESRAQLVTQTALFACGWVALLAMGTALTLCGYSPLALLSVSVIGFVCSLVGFRSLEMPFGMLVFITLGIMLLPLTQWAWIAPMPTGGFMVSVVLERLMERRSKKTEKNAG